MAGLTNVPYVSVAPSDIKKDHAPAQKSGLWASLRTSRTQRRFTQSVPLFSKVIPGEPLAFDSEHINHIWNKGKPVKRFGRVSVTNAAGEVILDVYVRYHQQAGLVQRCDPPEFGVEFDDLRASNGAVPADWAINCMKQLFHGHPIIMHGNTNDMLAFGHRVDQVFAHSTVIDTQDLYGQVKLKTLCAEVLQKPIQQGYHSSVEDARATMALWIKHTGYDRSGPLRAHMEVMTQRAAVKKAEEEKIAARKAAFKEAAAQQAAQKAKAAALKKQVFQKSDDPGTRTGPSKPLGPGKPHSQQRPTPGIMGLQHSMAPAELTRLPLRGGQSKT